MVYSLDFSHLLKYDAGKAGISLEVKISVVGSSALYPPKLTQVQPTAFFARKYGEQLGLDIEAGERINISTATSTFLTFRHSVTLTVLDYEVDAAICFAENEHFERNVLGRRGFLDRFLIGLNDYEGELYLSSLEEIWN